MADERPRFERVPVGKILEMESVLVDRRGRVWVTGIEPGQPVYCIEGDAVRVAYRGEGPAFSRGPLLEGSDGRLWVGGTAALMSHAGGAWDEHELSGVRLMAEEPGTGRIWAANAQGLFRREDGQFVEVKDVGGRSMDRVTALAPAAGHGLWLGWLGQGLALLRHDGVRVDLGPSKGTLMESIGIIHDDGVGGLWLAGDQGIVRVATADLLAVAEGRERRVKARLLDSESGLVWNAHLLFARQPVVPRTPDGRLWFPTSKGLAVVNPLLLGINPRPPRLVPGSARWVDGAGRVHEAGWLDGGTVRLPPGSRALRVEFAALHFAAPGRVTCSTRLAREGRVIVERFGPERHADYELLPPGTYALQVSASNEDGVWAPMELGMGIVVEPHYWQTRWFGMALFAGLAGLVVAGAGYWVRQTRLNARLALAERDRLAAVESAERAEALRVSEALRLKAEGEAEWRRRREAVIRDVHDGIGGLASNLKMTVSVAQRARDFGSQKSMLAAMEGLVGETLLEVHGLMDILESEVSSVGELGDEFRRHGLVVLQAHDIELEVRLEGADRAMPRSPDFFLAMFRMFKEALSNVIKHARATRVEAVLMPSEAGLVMRVRDDGVGMAAGGNGAGAAGSGLRHGRGIVGMRRRAEELGGELRIECGPGTVVVVDVPWPRPTALVSGK